MLSKSVSGIGFGLVRSGKPRCLLSPSQTTRALPVSLSMMVTIIPSVWFFDAITHPAFRDCNKNKRPACARGILPMPCNCQPCQEARMSRRTIRDYIHQAFLSRDKASVAAVADEAEQAFAQPNEEKDGGDDGDDKDHSGHQGGVHVHIEHGGKEPSTDAKSADARFAKIEDSIAKLTKTISRVADAVGVKDGEMPEELRQARAGQGEGQGEAPDESDGDGDGDDGEKKNPFAAKD